MVTGRGEAQPCASKGIVISEDMPGMDQNLGIGKVHSQSNPTLDWLDWAIL